MYNINNDLLDRTVEQYPGIAPYYTDITYGHRSYKWERVPTIIFKFNERTKYFYIKDPNYKRNGGYVNKGKVDSIIKLKELIELAIDLNNIRDLYKIKYYMECCVVKIGKEMKLGDPQNFTEPQIPYDYH